MQHGKHDSEGCGDEHIKGCAERSSDERLSGALVRLCEWARAAADRPEDFWERQRLGVNARLAQGRTDRRWLAARSSAAVIIVALGLVFLTKTPRQPISDFVAESEQDLLGDVERSLRRSVPASFEPAMLPAHEVISGTETKSTPSGRESTIVVRWQSLNSQESITCLKRSHHQIFFKSSIVNRPSPIGRWYTYGLEKKS